MKILHIIPSLNKRGVKSLVLDIYNKLSKSKDIEVKLITFRAENPHAILTKTFGCEMIYLKLRHVILDKKS